MTAYNVAVEQQLGKAMYLDRAMRFQGNFDEAYGMLEKAQHDAAQAWQNFHEHRSEHSN